jgi:(p)ppGpp synthase/HD superfamily hydrolase
MVPNHIIDAVRDFANRAHGEQTRKYTYDPYIVHPVRVMETCCSYIDDVAMCAAAILHDVLEDTEVTRGELYDFLCTVMDNAMADKTIELVEELTDVYVEEKFPQFNRKLRKSLEAQRMSQISKDAQTIKYADIIDNCKQIVDDDPGFAKTYLKECRRLLEKMKLGNPALRQRALELVNNQIGRIVRIPYNTEPMAVQYAQFH